MLDFLVVKAVSSKKGVIEVYPEFTLEHLDDPSSDLMIRGADFYAIWNDKKGLWSTKKADAVKLIDQELDKYAKEHFESLEGVRIMHLKYSSTGMIDKWNKFCKSQAWDSWNTLDEKLVFSNSPTRKEDYASKRLKYPLEEGPTDSYDRLMSVLYSEEERHKIEWCIGAIVSGASINLQKFAVFYGSAGTGKSTVLNIIQQLFDGYYVVFDAKALGSESAAFALEPFKSNPLVGIQHDGDLSKIEDNTRLNSLVSHESQQMNAKFEKLYSMRLNAFLFMGTNKPVKITDAKSGLLRRLIDISPTGNKLTPSEYRQLTNKIKFELGAIANKCKEIYLDDPDYYDEYVPINMMSASNDFYNFMMDSYMTFKQEDGVAKKVAWEMYKNYCDDAKVPYPFSQRIFTEELKNYFWEFHDRFTLEDGTRLRSYYSGFRSDKFEVEEPKKKKKKGKPTIDFNSRVSLLDKDIQDCPAQLATIKETPQKAWDDVTTKLCDIDTTKLHYVRVPENHIVIDFDIKDKEGNKSLELNLEAASKFPATYAELSKSGKGIHLHYIYTGGDPKQLRPIYDDNIEVKVFTGKSSLRRKLTWCNDIPIANINSGLPLKEDVNKVISDKNIKNVKQLRSLINRSLSKEFGSTTVCVSFIKKILDEAYDSGMQYDVTEMSNRVMLFAMNSTNQSRKCMDMYHEMHFKSEEVIEQEAPKQDIITFYDVEVFPNLFLINWKYAGPEHKVVRMINPTPSAVAELMTHKLVGFNCRRYDNHILYARVLGFSEAEIFDLSQRIIDKRSSTAFFGEAYNASYVDVYDMSSKKQSLKKWEIELGLHHDELGMPWDKPVPQEMWTRVAEYCDYDVLATEAVYNHLEGDLKARIILSALTGLQVNDTTNSQTTRLIFGKNKTPQNEFFYRDLAKPVKELPEGAEKFLNSAFPDMMNYWKNKDSLLPYFDGYEYKFGKSYYRGYEVGEGGFVWADPGMYFDVVTYDVASMHPHSLLSEMLFGLNYTPVFHDLVQTRIKIKHKDFEGASKLFNGKLTPYLTDPAEAKALSSALKIAINSVYGLTSAKFENPFRDPRNVDNIVAKRGALFMITLKEEVEKRGGKVVHIKTDSIKIVAPTKELEQFVYDFGKAYGYSFEVEHHFERFCLVNDAVYVGKCAEDDPEAAGEWTATGAEFQVPYVFKTLFSGEPITFDDLCETKSVTSSLYLDFNEDTVDRIAELEKQLATAKRKNLDSKDIETELESLHNRIFVGKVGRFCPIKPGKGGGELLRLSGTNPDGSNKYASATGAKGYRWLESEMVKVNEREDDIDKSYYQALADAAIAHISEFGDINSFRD